MKTVTPISIRGFTLIELLLVVAILAILSTVVVVVINPAELLKQARDAIRLSDLGAVNKTLSISQVSAIPLGSSTIVYVSIPDTSVACANLGLPALPTGWLYQCASSSSYLNANGTGWIPVNFNLIPGGSSLSALPIDPVNTTSSGLYYLYVPSNTKWAIATGLESQKYFPKAANDGGYDPGRYEIGTDLSLIAKAEGLAGWWTFDEGSGQYAYDSSGNGNTGTLINGPTWAFGKVNGALNFDGSNDYVNAGNVFSLNNFTFSFWAKWNTLGTYTTLISKSTTSSLNGGYWMFKDNNNKFQLYLLNGVGSSPYFTTTNAITSASQWYYITATWDGTNVTGSIKMYVNGQQWTGTELNYGTYPASNSLNLLIGANNGPSNFFNGSIDEVRIYNRVLSAEEILNLYNSEK